MTMGRNCLQDDWRENAWRKGEKRGPELVSHENEYYLSLGIRA